MAVADNLHLGYATRATVWGFESLHQTFQEEATIFLRRPRSFQVGRTDIEREPRAWVSVWGTV